MRVINYVNNVLTVINNGQFYKKESKKPDFISGDNFYYEPSLKMMDNKKLNKDLINQAESFIDNFKFDIIKPKKEYKHYIDNDGNYLGYLLETEKYQSVSIKPKDTLNYPYYFKDQFIESVLINKNTKKFVGFGDTRSINNTEYAPLSTMLPNFENKYQFYIDVKWNISIEDAKRSKIKKIKEYQIKEVNKIINTDSIGYLEFTSFNIQEEEAKNYLKDNTYLTPFIDNLAKERKQIKKDLIDAILKKASYFKIEYSKILGKYQVLVKTINNCKTIEEIDKIVW